MSSTGPWFRSRCSRESFARYVAGVDESERRRQGNARGAIALVALTAIAGLVAWRNRPDPTVEESPVSSDAMRDPIDDEMLAGLRTRPERPDANLPDSGTTTRIVPTSARVEVIREPTPR